LVSSFDQRPRVILRTSVQSVVVWFPRIRVYSCSFLVNQHARPSRAQRIRFNASTNHERNQLDGELRKLDKGTVTRTHPEERAGHSSSVAGENLPEVQWR
jgi:hypothetical protein